MTRTFEHKTMLYSLCRQLCESFHSTFIRLVAPQSDWQLHACWPISHLYCCDGNVIHIFFCSSLLSNALSETASIVQFIACHVKAHASHILYHTPRHDTQQQMMARQRGGLGHRTHKKRTRTSRQQNAHACAPARLHQVHKLRGVSPSHHPFTWAPARRAVWRLWPSTLEYRLFNFILVFLRVCVCVWHMCVCVCVYRYLYRVVGITWYDYCVVCNLCKPNGSMS